MKKIFVLFIVLVSLLTGAIFFYAIPNAEKEILTHVEKLGYKNAKLTKTSFLLSGLSIDRIDLDNDGFSYIENIDVNLFWPTYLFNKKIDLISANKISIATANNDLKSVLTFRNHFNFSEIAEIEAKKIEAKKIIWDISSSQGAIRIEGKGSLEENNDNSHSIVATFEGHQHELTFSSNWTGSFDNKNNMTLEGALEEISINFMPLNLHRGTGWLSYESKGNESAISGQLDSGSGKIFDVPINNINFTIGKKDDYYPILFRADASGIENVNFSSDIHYSKNSDKQALDVHLNIGNPSSFIEHLINLNIIKSNTSLDIPNKTSIDLVYMRDKRFADGPLPFDLSVTQQSQNILGGTLLIYPDSFDIRGTAQGQESFIKSIQPIFSIKDENISEDFLRINGNLKRLIAP